MTIPFLSVEISGLATQAYNSGAVNRKFINDVSGAIWTEFGNLDTFNSTLYITSANSIDRFADSSATQTKLGNKQDTLTAGDHSTDWETAHDWYVASAQKLSASSQIAFYDSAHVDHDATTNFVSDEHVAHGDVSITAGAGLTGGGTIAATRDISVGEGTGIFVDTNEISVKGYATISSNAKLGADYVASGNEYSAAYDWYVASAQKLSDNNSGWASVPEDNPIAHGLSAAPKSIQITPSGLVTFAYAISAPNASNFTVSISAPGNRMINWRASVYN